MKKICFIIAMQAEARPLIDHFGLQPVDNCFAPLPQRAYQTRYGEYEITLVQNGTDPETGLDHIGCEAATLTTQLAVSTFRPDLIVNAGTAGAFGSKGAQIGDIYLSRRHVVFHDRRISIGQWAKMGQGYYPCLDTDALAEKSGYKQGVCTTGSSLDLPEIDLAEMEKTGGEVKDMEAAAIAWVAQLYEIPLLCVKSITDLVDSECPTAEAFNANLHRAAERLRDACFTLVDNRWL